MPIIRNGKIVVGDFVSTGEGGGSALVPSMTQTEYDALSDAEKMNGQIREIVDAEGMEAPFAVVNDEMKTTSNIWSAKKTSDEVSAINNKIPSDASSTNKLVSQSSLNGSLADYAKTEALTDYEKKELSFFEILSRPNKYIGNYNVNNKFSGWVAPYDCIVVCEIAKNNNEGSQNVYIYVDSIQVDAFIGLNFPYTNSTFYIPMKKNQKLTFLLDGEWAYHQAYIYFH